MVTSRLLCHRISGNASYHGYCARAIPGDMLLSLGIQGMTVLIIIPGLINLDFADVRA